jgi:hypothetical protein
MRKATRPKLRLHKGQLESGAEYYYSARPSRTAKETLSLVSKPAKARKVQLPKKVAKATKPPVITRPVREKAKGAEKTQRAKKG